MASADQDVADTYSTCKGTASAKAEMDINSVILRSMAFIGRDQSSMEVEIRIFITSGIMKPYQ